MREGPRVYPDDLRRLPPVLDRHVAETVAAGSVSTEAPPDFEGSAGGPGLLAGIFLLSPSNRRETSSSVEGRPTSFSGCGNTKAVVPEAVF